MNRNDLLHRYQDFQTEQKDKTVDAATTKRNDRVLIIDGL